MLRQNAERLDVPTQIVSFNDFDILLTDISKPLKPKEFNETELGI